MLTNHLQEASEPSLQNSVDDNYRKALVIAAASYYEMRVRELIITLVHDRTAGDELLVAFVKQKAIERQYHTFFNWEQRSGGQFFGMFGPGFKDHMKNVLKAEGDLASSVGAFIELGELRNRLVHQDFASFPLDKTADEIFALYETARLFVETLQSRFRTYTEKLDQ
jgi:hypothetical protein